MAVRHITVVKRIQVLVIYEDSAKYGWNENNIVEELRRSLRINKKRLGLSIKTYA